jgi:galactokinase
MHARELAARFERRFGGAPRVFRAPGRVNLIGEHTDYNDGFVMPAAVPFATEIATAPTGDRRLTIHSENFKESIYCDLDDPDPRPRGHWSDYVRGVAVTLGRSGHLLRGANLLIRGDVPLGAGLSSSASLEVSTALALLEISQIHLERAEVARLCQQAEHQFAGVRCGIMDQFTACFARRNHALLLDCRSLEARVLPLRGNATIVVSNTMVKHELAAGEYNRRRQECERGVRELSRFIPGIRALRDVTPEELQEFGSALDPIVLRRCRHVVTENARVLAAAQALDRGDLAGFGHLMQCSHRSLRDDYEVSCAELDTMVELASHMDGVYGSRMTGGGFGGCTVSLVHAAQAETFAQKMFEAYSEETGIRCEVYICPAAEGASEEAV